MSGTLLAAGWVARVNKDTLVEFLAPVKALNLPLLATLSDKQPALVLALEESWKDTPHQFCQAHYLTNAADPLYKTDEQMKTQLRKQVRAAAGATMRQAQADVQKKPNRQKDPLVITGLAAQPPQKLDEIRQLAAKKRDQAVNHESSQSLDSHDMLSENLTSEQLNEQAIGTSSQNMTDQLSTFDADSLLAGSPLTISSEVEIDQHRSCPEIANPLAVLTSDSSATVVLQCEQESFACKQAQGITINISNDDEQFDPIGNQAQSSISTGSKADTVNVPQEAELSDSKSAVDQSIKFYSSDLYLHENLGSETPPLNPTLDSQKQPAKEQGLPNQLKNEVTLAASKAKTESVLDMVRAKLAETPVVVFDRTSKKSSLNGSQINQVSSLPKILDKQDQTDELVAAYADRLRRVLSVSGRKPYKFAGLRLYSDLLTLLGSLERSLEHLANESRLECFADSIREALVDFEERYSTIAEGYSWLLDISTILDSPLPEPGEPLDLEFNWTMSGTLIEEDLMTVRQRLEGYLDWLKTRTDLSRSLLEYRDHLCGLTERYAKGLFNCYQIAGLPRTNNGLESHFGTVRRRILCTVGPYRAQQMLHDCASHPLGGKRGLATARCNFGRTATA